MTDNIVFKVLNPNDGSYTDCATLEKAKAHAKLIAWNFYMMHTHNAPISKVVMTEEGAEIWGTLE